MIISNIAIHKRTFEGATDDTKNDNPITSKYRPSKKYAVSYDADGYKHNPFIDCVVTKRDALALVVRLKSENETERCDR